MDRREFEPVRPEFSLPPPEYQPPGREHFPPPPEFGQGSGTNVPAEKKRRVVRRLAFVAALVPVLWLFAHPVSAPAAQTPPETAPAPQSAAVTTEPISPQPTQPAPTEAPPSTEPPAPPEFSAALTARGLEACLYQGSFRYQGSEGNPPSPVAFVARAYAQDGTPAGEFPIGEDALPQAESDPEGGWRYVYAGTLPWQSLPEEADRCSLCLTVEDPNTGTSYALESNTVPVEIYPLTEGEIQVTVYNETTIFEVPTVVPNDFYMTILLQQTLPAAEFESLTLPRAIAPEGAVFMGYAVHFGNPYDNGASQNAGADAFAFLLPGSDSETAEPVLTQQDVMRIPPAPDGVRYVNLHALWWVEENPSLLLDDGVSEVIQLNPYAFLYSEGFAYLDALPVPEREGYWFAGWYDEDGNPVHLLAYTDHCDPIYDENGNLEDYDWQSFHPITLVAHWVEQ